MRIWRAIRKVSTNSPTTICAFIPQNANKQRPSAPKSANSAPISEVPASLNGRRFALLYLLQDGLYVVLSLFNIRDAIGLVHRSRTCIVSGERQFEIALILI